MCRLYLNASAILQHVAVKKGHISTLLQQVKVHYVLDAQKAVLAEITFHAGNGNRKIGYWRYQKFWRFNHVKIYILNTS